VHAALTRPRCRHVSGLARLTRLIQTAKAQEETIYYLTQKMHQYQDNLPEFLRVRTGPATPMEALERG